MGDLGQLMEMSKAMNDESPNYRDEVFSEEKTERILKFMIDTGCCLVAEDNAFLVGMIGGFVVSAPVHDYTFMTDMGLYVRPEDRGSSVAYKLVKTFESIAEAKGVKKIVLGVSTGVHARDTTDFYDRLGYSMFSYGMMKNV